MPGLDGTGPQGRGPMTGRVFGRCRTGYQAGEQTTAIVEEKPLLPGEITQTDQQTTQGSPQGYGAGRGGIPCGGGRGFAFGGRGRGRCFR